MAEVYGSCSLTIAAVASKDSSEGLCRYNPPLEMRLEKSLLSVPLLARRDTHEGPLPLLSRGWTFQEERLSKRIVFLTEHELTWKCSNKVTKCQCNEEDRGELLRRNCFDDDLDAYMADFVPRSLYKSWKRDLVQEYSYRKLTKPEDRLPALSGIARFFQATLREEAGDQETKLPQYLAGMWRDDLLEQLLWIAKQPTTANHVYVAPTWSWASINGPIDFRSHADFNETYGRLPYQYEANILKAVCIPATSDSFGRLSGGYLEINTAFFPSQVFLECERTRCVAYRSQEDIEEARRGIEFKSVFLDSDIANRGSGSLNVFCAVVQIRSTVIWCLLLEPTENDCSIFRRIGLAEDTTPEDDVGGDDKKGSFWIQSFIPDIISMSRSVVKVI